jgi:protein-disulfide isomerase
MCIVTYVVNLLLLYYAWIIRRRFPETHIFRALRNDFQFMWTKRKQAIPLFSLFFVCVVLLYVFIPHYWEFSTPPLRAEIHQGTTEDGHPWIGAENPRLAIIEYTDYLCFQCKKMHFYLRQLTSQHPDKIRLIHHHYPMDNEFNPTVVPEVFHVGSGRLSLLAIYAGTQGKFWKMNDILFTIARESKTIDLRKLSKEVGLDFRSLARSINDPRIKKTLQIDIWKGMKLRVIGTPTYLIDGKLYQGYIPPNIIRQALK